MSYSTTCGRDPGGRMALLRRYPMQCLMLLAWLALIGILLLPVAAPFFSDDHIYLVDNLILRQLRFAELGLMLEGHSNDYEYLPLRDFSYWLDLQVFGLWPAGFRLENLLLYLSGCGLAGLLVQRLCRLFPVATPADRRVWQPAALAALLFALHPAHLESVVWVSGRKDLLSGLLVLLAFWLFCIGLERRTRLPQVLGGLSYALAMWSKATVVPLPLLLGVVALAAHRQLPVRQRLLLSVRQVAPYAVIGLVLLIQFIRHSNQSGVTVAFHSHSPTTPLGQLHQALLILGGLLEKALLPVSLQLYYDPYAPGQALPLRLWGAVGLGWAIVGSYQFLRYGRLWGLSGPLFLIFALPFLQLIPFSTFSLVSERFLFIPVLAPVLPLVLWLHRLGAVQRLAALAVVVIIALGILLPRSLEWRDPGAMQLNDAERTPWHYGAQAFVIQSVLLPEGKFAEAQERLQRLPSDYDRHLLGAYVEVSRALSEGRRDLALEQIRRLSEITLRNPEDPRWLFRMNFLARQAYQFGDLGLARRLYGGMLARSPHLIMLYYNLGLIEAREGHFQQAIEAFEHARARGSFALMARADLLNNLGLAYKATGQWQQAEQAFNDALQISPLEWRAAVNLSGLQEQLGREQPAAENLQKALRRLARHPDRDPSLEAALKARLAIVVERAAN